MKLYVSSATGSIYDENTLRESFFMMRNAAPDDEHNGVAAGGKQARTSKRISGSMEGINEKLFWFP